MSIIAQYQKRISELENDKEQMLVDIKLSIEAILDTTADLGLNLLDGSLSNTSPMKILAKVTPKIMRGGLKLEKLTSILPIVDKYKHLIEPK